MRKSCAKSRVVDVRACSREYKPMPDEDVHRVAGYGDRGGAASHGRERLNMPPLQSARARSGRVLLASSDAHTQATLRAMLAGCDAVVEISEAWSLPEACGLARSADLVLFEATEAGRLGITAALDGLRAAGAPAVIVVSADSDPGV